MRKRSNPEKQKKTRIRKKKKTIQTTRCMRCNRWLKDPESVAAGMGRTCRQKARGPLIREKQQELEIKPLPPERTEAWIKNKREEQG